jgi:hypothetical protein
VDDLRWFRPDLDCEPQQARGIPRNLQLDETGFVRAGTGGALGSGWAVTADPVALVKRTVVAKIWAGLMAVAIELLLLGWMVGSHGVDCLTAGLALGR